MKKLLVGLAAVGALIALRPVAGRKMREHCERMAGKCKEMMASQSGQYRAPETRGCCQEMTAAHEKAETTERSEPEAPQFVGKGEAVAV